MTVITIFQQKLTTKEGASAKGSQSQAMVWMSVALLTAASLLEVAFHAEGM